MPSQGGDSENNMPLNDKRMTYANIKIDIGYIGNRLKVSDFMTEDEFETMNEKEIRRVLLEKINNTKPQRMIKVYVKD